MDTNCLYSKNELIDELETDACSTEGSDDKHLRLLLLEGRGGSGDVEEPYGDKQFDNDDKWGPIAGPGEGRPDADLESATLPALSIYFKSINKYPLLDEESERTLAQLIKKGEKECINLIMGWCRVFRREWLRLVKHSPTGGQQQIRIQQSDFIGLFDEIADLGRKRDKLTRLVKRSATSSEGSHKLQEELQKVEADISKSIARIQLGERTLNTFYKRIKKISCPKNSVTKRREVETELRKTLRSVNNTLQEIKIFKNQLVEANLRLVISIAKKYLHHGVTLPDLIQEGNLGLMRAIDTYDYRRGHRLVTYATWWIRQAMIRAIDCQSRTVRTPVYVNEKLNQIVKASNRLLQALNREPTLTEIAEETKIPLEHIEKTVQCYKDAVPLDVLIDEQGEQVANPCIADEGASVTEQAISADLSHIINDLVLADLTQREQEIVRLRFGIGEHADHTLEEIGEAFSLSRERIRQILEMALHKIRTPKQMVLLKDFFNPN